MTTESRASAVGVPSANRYSSRPRRAASSPSRHSSRRRQCHSRRPARKAATGVHPVLSDGRSIWLLVLHGMSGTLVPGEQGCGPSGSSGIGVAYGRAASPSRGQLEQRPLDAGCGQACDASPWRVRLGVMSRVRVGRLADQGGDEAALWKRRSVEARVAAALELHAFWLKTHDQASRGLDRVLEVAQREPCAVRHRGRARGRRARKASSHR